MIRKLGMVAALSLMWVAPAAARDIGGVACTTPQAARCIGEACIPAMANFGNATDAKTGRKFFLDYPCDLKPGEKVTFILNIHGAGGIGNWQRHYFPAVDFVQKHRLVIATPTAATANPIRRWVAEADDAHLQNITDQVFEAFGRENIKAMWLAGHSQGGFTSNRIVCSDYFKTRVDGWLSLSGGRIGAAPFVAAFGPPGPGGAPPAPRPPGAGPPGMGPAIPACEFSHIFAIGEYEISALPETSPWAERYGCAKRTRREVVDEKPGYVWDYSRHGYKVWGMKAGPGKAEVFQYPKCKDGRVVADVVRIDKGHTEGLEPNVTEAIVKLITSAKGGKARSMAGD